MNKLRLEIDSLNVQGFEVATEKAERGTVHGQGHVPDTIPFACPATRNWYCTVGSTCTMYPQYCTAV